MSVSAPQARFRRFSISVTRGTSGAIALLSLGLWPAACSGGFHGSNCEASRTCPASAGSGSTEESAGGADADLSNAGAAGSEDAGVNEPSAGGGSNADGGEGSMASACPSGRVACDGACIDPVKDASFCGATGSCNGDERGAACGANEACIEGECASDEATLSSLSVSPATLSPRFSADVRSYRADFAYFESQATLQATPTSAKASLLLDGEPFAADEGVSIALPAVGAAPTLSLQVKSPSGKTQSYIVDLERKSLVTTYVKPFNTRPNFNFGEGIAIDGDTAVFGAFREDSLEGGIDGDDTTTGNQSGAVYVAVRGPNGYWARQAFIKSDPVADNRGLGYRVAIDGDTLAATAVYATERGAVLIFTRTGSTWEQQAIIHSPSTDVDLRFGTQIALDGDRLVVAPGSSSLAGSGSGAVYSFTRHGQAWTSDAVQPLPPPDHFVGNNDGFGASVALSGNRVAFSEKNGESAIFVMRDDGAGWTLESAISLPNGELAGAQVALEGDTLAAAVPGAVHVFTHSGASWTEQGTLTSFDPAADEGFGSGLALDGDLLVVGSSCSTCVGGASTFVRRGGSWVPGRFVSVDGVPAGDALGAHVAVSGGTIVVSAVGDDSSAKSFNRDRNNDDAVSSGAAFILE